MSAFASMVDGSASGTSSMEYRAERTVLKGPLPGTPIHLVQVGPYRTATTLQHMTVCAGLVLRLWNYPRRLSRTFCGFWGEHHYLKATANSNTVWKEHTLKRVLQIPPSEVTAAFTTRADYAESLRKANHTVGLLLPVRDAARMGYHSALAYQRALGLTDDETDVLLQFIRWWDVLRVCCGPQMSEDWREMLHRHPFAYKFRYGRDDPGSPACGTYNISAVELAFLNNKLAKRMYAHSPRLNPSPFSTFSAHGDELDGTYCARYNEAVRTRGIGFNQGLGCRDPPRLSVKTPPCWSKPRNDREG